MSKEEIIENNKLIARFMGTTYEQKKNTHGVVLYQVSWDWLMPIVEKIESLYDDFHGHFGVHIISNGCTIQGTKLKPGKVNAYFDQQYNDVKIKAVYSAIINFIKWYNNGV